MTCSLYLQWLTGRVKWGKRLLDYRSQKDYYDKIVERYIAFCAHNVKDLDGAMASLPSSPSSVATRNRPVSQLQRQDVSQTDTPRPSPSTELSKLLLALRKLREAVLATSSSTLVSFSQKVYIFSIRTGILAQHPPSYFPSLQHLLGTLHSSSHPLADSEAKEFITYLILDYACRQEDMRSAFELRARARKLYKSRFRTIDRVLAALLQGNWVVFWQVRNSVDSYMRAIIDWAAGQVRRRALKAVGSAYLSVEANWILEGCTGEQGWTWGKLVEVEGLGWQKEDDRIIIKRPKRKPEVKLEQIKESTQT